MKAKLVRGKSNLHPLTSSKFLRTHRDEGSSGLHEHDEIEVGAGEGGGVSVSGSDH